jgi:hypothetical protein
MFDGTSAANLATLKNELLTDPKAYGYAGVASGDVLADKLNLVRVGEQIPRDNLVPADIFTAIVPSEWTTANMVLIKVQYLDLLFKVTRIDLSNGNVKAALDLVFPSGTAPLTNAAMHALYLRNGSRAETLFGPESYVSGVDVAHAQQS